MARPIITFEERFRRETRRRKLTAMEIIQRCGTTTPSKRLSEIRAKGKLGEEKSLRHFGLKVCWYKEEAA